MTRKTKKLSLNRETVRQLSREEMGRANGGTIIINTTNLNSIACPTMVQCSGLPSTLRTNFPGCTGTSMVDGACY